MESCLPDAVPHPLEQHGLRELLHAAGDPVESLAIQQPVEEPIRAIRLRAASRALPAERVARVEPDEPAQRLVDLLNPLGIGIGSQPHELVLVLERHHAHEVGDHRVDVADGVGLLHGVEALEPPIAADAHRRAEPVADAVAR